jgi:hypothetical protein
VTPAQPAPGAPAAQPTAPAAQAVTPGQPTPAAPAAQQAAPVAQPTVPSLPPAAPATQPSVPAGQPVTPAAPPAASAVPPAPSAAPAGEPPPPAAQATPPAVPSTPPATPPAQPAPPPVPPPPLTPPAAAAVQSVAPEHAEAILGQRVTDAEGKEIGRLVDVLVDASGKPQAAVIDFGGFMGVGNRKIAVHWGALRFNPADPKYKVALDMTPDQVKAAPEFRNPNKAAPVVTPAPPAVEPVSKSP